MKRFALLNPGRSLTWQIRSAAGLAVLLASCDGLYISLVQHKAFVDVNEKGTEAAAATAVDVARSFTLLRNLPFTPTFRADRPFFFAIRDRKSGALLFVGRVMRPPAGDEPR